MDPLTIGLVSGGIGLLGSLFGGGDDPQYTLPRLEELRKTNPDLYDQLMQIKYMSEQARNQAAREGITAAERFQMDDARSGLRSQQSNRGLAGSSAAVSQQAELANRMAAAQAERALREEMARRSEAANLAGSYLNAYRGIAAPMADARYRQDLSNQQARSNFFGGMLQTGIGMLGQDAYLDRLGSVMSPASGGGGTNPAAIDAMAQAATKPWNPPVQLSYQNARGSMGLPYNLGVYP